MRRAITVVATILAVGTVGAIFYARAEDSSTMPVPPDSGVQAPQASRIPDFTGEWRLDFGRSDSLRGPGGQGGRRGPRMGGSGGPGGPGPGAMGGGGPRWGRGRGEGGPGRNGGRPLRLPNLMHVTHAEPIVSFEDSTGTVVLEITTVAAASDTLAHAPNARQLRGAWSAERLEVRHAGRGGAKIVDTYFLEDGGRSLVIRTAIEAMGDMPAREFKRVYRRES